MQFMGEPSIGNTMDVVRSSRGHNARPQGKVKQTNLVVMYVESLGNPCGAFQQGQKHAWRGQCGAEARWGGILHHANNIAAGMGKGLQDIKAGRLVAPR